MADFDNRNVAIFERKDQILYLIPRLFDFDLESIHVQSHSFTLITKNRLLYQVIIQPHDLPKSFNTWKTKMTTQIKSAIMRLSFLYNIIGRSKI